MRKTLWFVALPIVALLGEGQALNPPVKVLDHPTSPVPADCGPAAPARTARLMPEEIAAAPRPVALAATAVASAMTVPRAALPMQMTMTQKGLEADDRERFADWLERTKSTLENIPPGGERDAAQNVVKVWDDAATVWDYQRSSTTGAFFDAWTPVYAVSKNYPELMRTINKQAIKGSHGLIYPTAETREFLAQEAGRRLGKVSGVKWSPPRIIRMESHAPAGRTSSSVPLSPRRAERAAGMRGSHVAHAPVVHARKLVSTPASAPAATPIQAPHSVSPLPASRGERTVVSATPLPIPTTSTTATATTATVAPAPLTATEAATTTQPEAPKPQPAETPLSGGRLIVAVVIVLLAAGLLVAFLRAS
jgi:hypothetical protein